MIEAIVVCEGLTEETFIRDVVAPALWGRDIVLDPRQIRTSAFGRGGDLNRDRVVSFLAKTLRQRTDTYVTTLFDLYGLRSDFPGVQACAGITDPVRRAATIEGHLAEVVVQAAGSRTSRFLPHIQPNEFEALLFSDVAQLVGQEEGWAAAGATLQAIRAEAPTPEHINDGPLTHPSAHLMTLQKPRYDKVRHGPLIAARIGLPRIRAECAHFDEWITRLENLKPLQ